MRRDAACAVGIVLSLCLAAAQPAAAAPPRDLAAALDEATGALTGAVSVVVIDLATGYSYERDPGARLEAASLFKVFVMATLCARAEDDPAILSAVVPVVRPHVSDGDIEYRPELETVSAALEEMIDWSDNSAGAALVEMLGTDEVNATIAGLGLVDTVVFSGEPSGNTTSARDLARFFVLLARRGAISPAASDAMMWVLLHQGINDRVSRGIPADALFAHKTGNSAGTYHDAGILWTPLGQRVVVVLTAGADPEQAGTLMEDVGRAAYTLPVPLLSARD